MQKKSMIFSLGAVLFLAGAAQAACDINTYAGDGVPGAGGDGGPATAAQLQQPTGVGLDGSGNLYIADHGNNRIQEVSPAGVISTLAGSGAYGFSGDNGPAIAATFANPQGVHADALGNVYVADTFNNRIRKISTTGIISTVAGNGSSSSGGDGGPAVAAGINGPYALALDPAGTHLFIADTQGNRIREVDLGTGIISTVAGSGSNGFSGDGGPAGSAELSGPRGVLVDALGDIFIADTFNNRIREVSGGIINTVAGDGALGYSGDNGAATLAALRVPQGLGEDAAAGIFVADTGNNVIRRFTVNGTIATVAGGGYTLGDGGPAVGAGFNGPWDCTLDSAGDLYIADTYDYRVRIVAGCFAGVPSSPIPSPTASSSATPTATSSPVQTPVLSATATAVQTLTRTPSETGTPTETRTSSETRTQTETRTPQTTATATSAGTPVSSASATSSPTSIASTPTSSQTAASATATGTNTPQTETSTVTGTSLPTSIATASATMTSSPAASSSPTTAITASASSTPTGSPADTGTETVAHNSGQRNGDVHAHGDIRGHIHRDILAHACRLDQRILDAHGDIRGHLHRDVLTHACRLG